MSSRSYTFLPTTKVSSGFLALYLGIVVILGFVFTSSRFEHWFIFPLLASLLLIGSDAIDWFRGRVDVFDPIGIIGLMGLHFFFMAPLLHVHWDHWLLYVEYPDDWLHWLGVMATLNFFGLLVYRFTRNLFLRPEQPPVNSLAWTIDKKRFYPVITVALIITGLLQMMVYAQFGGITGYIDASIGGTHGQSEMRGLGWVFMISESFPILAMFAFAVYLRDKEHPNIWLIIVLGLVVFFFLRLLFGGLRGSRSTTIWALFWAVGVIHFWVRPIPKKLIFLGIGFLIVFMYFYGFFKSAGLDGVEALYDPAARSQLEEETNRTVEVTLLGDLGRSDVQAFVLYRIVRPDSDYEWAWGRTYVGSISLLIPRSVWHSFGLERPPLKVQDGTEALRGEGTYVPVENEASKVYGLAGETMLNFGPLLVPLSFIVLGVAVGATRSFLGSLAPFDTRLLLYPFLVNVCFMFLASDSDNMIFNIIKNLAIPFVVLLFGSSRIRITRERSMQPYDPNGPGVPAQSLSRQFYG